MRNVAFWSVIPSDESMSPREPRNDAWQPTYTNRTDLVK